MTRCIHGTELDGRCPECAVDPQDGNGWLPIETAPVDGSVFLARYQWLGKHRFMVIRRSILIEEWLLDGTSQIVGGKFRGMQPVIFTHWQPIKEPSP